MWAKTIKLLSWAYFAAMCAAVDPEVVYDGGYKGDAPVSLRIGNGGAGQSGLVGGLYLHFDFQ